MKVMVGTVAEPGALIKTVAGKPETVVQFVVGEGVEPETLLQLMVRIRVVAKREASQTGHCRA